MKKIAVILVLTLCFSMFFTGMEVFATENEKGFLPAVGELEITADAVLLKNIDTGKIIYSKNADKSIVPASLTKLLTAIVAIENTDDIDNEIVVHSQTVADYIYTYGAEHGALSNGKMMAGEEFTMREMLYAIMLPSANEAAMSIAEHIAGDQESFAEMLNQKAKEIGAKNTNFTNATGLPEDEHLSTAEDLLIIAEYALEIPLLKEIVGTVDYTVKETNLRTAELTWHTTNEMQNPEHSYYYPPLYGVKTGTLPSVGRNFISTASKDDYNYMLVLIGCEMKVDENGNPTSQEQRAFVEATAIYDWAFNNMRSKTVVNKGEIVGEIKVDLSLNIDFVQLETENFVSTLVPETLDLNSEEAAIVKKLVLTKDVVEAPVSKGDKLGEYIVEMAGEEVGRIPVVAASSVEASGVLIAVKTVKETSRSVWFKFGIIFIILLIVFYIILIIIKNRNKRKAQKRNRVNPQKYNKKD